MSKDKLRDLILLNSSAKDVFIEDGPDEPSLGVLVNPKRLAAAIRKAGYIHGSELPDGLASANEHLGTYGP